LPTVSDFSKAYRNEGGEVSMKEIEEQFYKYPKMLMLAQGYISMKTGEVVGLGEIEKNIYVVMKARNSYFENHYDKQSDIANMCNVSLRKAADVIREFTNHGIIESTKVYSGGSHKNLKYTKIHCLQLVNGVVSGKGSDSGSFNVLGTLSESLWNGVKKKELRPVNEEDIYKDQIPF
jgi:hypothetical protein